MRIELAKLLLKKPDVLLLDEPTNHLDIESIQWLEDFLIDNGQAVVVISHDRAFVDHITTRTIEVTMGRIYDYKVNYSQYLQLRKERREQQQKAYDEQQKMIAETREFIERFKGTYSKTLQVQSRVKMLEKLEILEVDEEDTSALRLKFPPSPRSGSYPVTIENVSKAYGDHTVFRNANLMIERGDKIAFVGKNGEGKSTLVKCIMKEIEHEGTLTLGHNVMIGYFAQNQASLLDENLTVFQTIDDVAQGDIRNKIKDLLGAFMFGGENSAKKVKVLSGGERTRLAMIKLLLEPVNLLILDEPTNHIDNDTVDWLEKHLEKYSKALLMVTHDRYFLDRVANRTLELEQGKLYSYQANYSKFLEMKAEREELIAAGERKRQNFLRTELEWVRRGAQARSTKQKARLQRFEEVSAIRAPEEKQSVELSSVGSRLGKKTIELRNICKAYDGKTYIKDFSYIILRDDRVGIIGDNGCGKSTLLNIMTGRLKPDSGEVEIGETVKIGVFAQENVDMDEKQRVIDYIRDEAEIIRTADGHITASQMLDRFLFPPSMQRGPISVLSGGERRRLYLCRVLMGAPNILFLDEPTNDLDIETLMILEEYLEHFNGAVVAVSHDRYFLDKTMGRIFAFLGNGRIKQYEGGYSDCKAAREKETPIFAEKAVKVKREEPQKEKAPIKKMSYKDQREYDTIGDEIAALEEKIAKTDADMAACATDFTHLQELSAEKEALEAKLEERMERWMELSELAEEIERNKA